MLCKDYSSSLSPHLFSLYTRKLNDFNILDPYEIPFSECERNVSEWPAIEHGDIVNYLVFSSHSITHNQMKSYKSLEAHNYYTSGWVNNRVFVKVLPENKALLLGEVNHSQSLRASPLKVWLLCKKDGEILTGHCTCMAGMGEACSHVGAFLFYLEAGVRLRKDESCTDKRNVWLQPHVRNVNFLKLKEIDFGSSSSKLKKCNNSLKNRKKQKSSAVPEPTDEELHNFFAKLDGAELSSAILTVVEPFNNKFISEQTIKELTHLYATENTKLTWQQLLDRCQDIINKLVITKSDAEEIEKTTKLQYKSKKWFMYRTGRVTASNMKAICGTDIDCPAKSVLLQICYPSLHTFSTSSTEWGKQNENAAREKFRIEVQNSHLNFKLVESGFHINPMYPYMGATPDAITTCDCCGLGIIEIKCPYVNRNDSIIEMCSKENSFLMEDDAGNITLNKTHSYYYQVQTQLLVTNSNHCDFVVWTSKDFFYERIYHDEIFQEIISEKSNVYFNLCILPELLAKWHSRN